MKFKKILIITSIVLVAFMSISLISAAQNTCGDNLTVSKAPTIQDTIDQASENSTVTLKGTYKNLQTISINKSITLTGKNAVLESGKNGLIKITGDNVVLKGITFTNGWNIKSYRNLTLISCSFNNNNPSKNSPLTSTLSNGNCLTIINCTFNKNSALSNSSYGGALSVISKDKSNSSKLIIKNTKFTNNKAINGGAINILTNESYIYTEISDCTFSKNTALTGTLRVENNGFKNRLVINNTRFTDNKMIRAWEYSKYNTDEEDPLFGIEDDNDIYGFYGSLGLDIQIEGTRMIYDKKMGPVEVMLSDFECIIDNCEFKNSIIDFESPISSMKFESNNITLKNCELTRSPILFRDYQLDLYLKGNTFYRCELNYNIYDHSAFDNPWDIDSWMNNPGEMNMNLLCENCEFKYSNNYLDEMRIQNCSFSKSVVSGPSQITGCTFEYDSYIIISLNDTTIANCNFKRNIVENGVISTGSSQSDYYNEIWPSSIPSEIDPISVKIINSTFTNNIGLHEGGAIYFARKNDTLIVENCSFINNGALNGGAIYAFASSESHIKNCIFDGNTVDILDVTTEPNEFYSEYDRHIHKSGLYFERIFDLNTKLTGYRYYANTYYGNVSVEDNFWGVNIDSIDEFVHDNMIMGLSVPPQRWINLKIEGNTLRFALNNGSEIDGMPNYSVKVNNEKVSVGSDIKNITLEDLRNNAQKPIVKKNAHAILTQKGTYINEKTIELTLLDDDGKKIANEIVLLRFNNSRTVQIKTNSEGKASYKAIVDVGTYDVEAIVASDRYKNLNDTLRNVEVKPLKIKASASKLTTTFDSNKGLAVKVTYKNKAVRNVDLKLTVHIGKKTKTYTITTNEKGIATFKPQSKLNVGTYKVQIASDANYIMEKITTTIKIGKAKTTVNAPKVTGKFMKSNFLKITVKNKESKKAVKNLVLKLKIGKKTYAVKTNSKGIAQFNTKVLKSGTYSVAVSSGNSNYEVSAKTTIIIKK